MPLDNVESKDNGESTKGSEGLGSPIEEFVNRAIKSDKVVIFSKTWCRYCQMVKSVFSELNEPYTAVELDLRDDGSQVQALLGRMTGTHTVPRIFIRGKSVGGCWDLNTIKANGKLAKLLAAKTS